MNLNKENTRKIRGIILFTGVVVLALIKFDLLWETLAFVWEILQPFVIGGMMAFVEIGRASCRERVFRAV